MWPKPSQDVRQMLKFKQTNIPAICGWLAIFWLNADSLNPKRSFAFHAWNKLAMHDANGGFLTSTIRFRGKSPGVIKGATEKEIRSHHWDLGAGTSRNCPKDLAMGRALDVPVLEDLWKVFWNQVHVAASVVERPRTKCAERTNEFWVDHPRVGGAAASAGSYGLAPQTSVMASSSTMGTPGQGPHAGTPNCLPILNVGFLLKGTQSCTGYFQAIIITVPLLGSFLDMHCWLVSERGCWDRWVVGTHLV